MLTSPGRGSLGEVQPNADGIGPQQLTLPVPL